MKKLFLLAILFVSFIGVYAQAPTPTPVPQSTCRCDYDTVVFTQWELTQPNVINTKGKDNDWEYSIVMVQRPFNNPNVTKTCPNDVYIEKKRNSKGIEYTQQKIVKYKFSSK